MVESQRPHPLLDNPQPFGSKCCLLLLKDRDLRLMVRTRHDTLSSMAVDRRVISCLCVLTESYNLQSLTDTGEISSTAELLSPEERFIADMNDLTDLRKSTHQIYTPTMRRWKGFCERHREEYEGPDGKSLYLVDSEAKVTRFVEEEVLIRTKSKRQKGSSGGGTSVSVGPDALKLARSSLGRIHRLQMRRKEVGKFAPSDMKVFHDKIEQCQKAQDEREGAHLVSTRSRDYYSLDNMVTALTVLWNGQGQRKDGRSFIEMFCISATHNMLLRDEELHQINFSDCFAVVTTQNRQPGAQQCVALTFKLKNNDRTSDANQKLYVSTLRHYDVTRCTFSAFAFYMFQIWQGATERDPRPERTLSAIFRDLGKEEWSSFKLLPSTDDPTVSSLPTGIWAGIRKDFKYLGVDFPRKANDGCHVGAAEATKLKIPQSDIDDKGRWSAELGSFGECHIPQLLTAVPEGMAGFLDKPYSLIRNSISPPIPLQMLIFPWIEFAFGVDNAWWKQECLDEMNEVIKEPSTTTTSSTKAFRKNRQAAASRKHRRKAGDSKGKQVRRDDRGDEDYDIVDNNHEADSAQDELYHTEAESDAESVVSAYSTPMSTAQEQAAGSSEDEDGAANSDGQSPPTTFSEANKVKASFLRLLVRCRRIILQDAAYRLHRHQPNKILDHDMFRCTMFKSFQQEIAAAVDRDAAVSRKRPREKSPKAPLAQPPPNHAAGARPPVQRQQQQEPQEPQERQEQQEPQEPQERQEQQEQPAAIVDNPSTTVHRHQQERHQPPALGALDQFEEEGPSTQPALTLNHHHYQPRGQAPPSSALASLEQQMLQLQHTVQAWSQMQEAQMQEMFSQHMKIHEMQQQMITTMMTALRTQQLTQMQRQYPPVGSSTGAPLPLPPHGHQQPNGVSSHAVDAMGAIAVVAAAPATAGTSSSKPSTTGSTPAIALVPASSKSKSSKEITTYLSFHRK
ncbi:hypothetical protein F5H01DRAFT_352398 [Linnemannia elongata]|nr:hypothetical protein F5H01DRAFT_352398 [Linnemannia elongata]